MTNTSGLKNKVKTACLVISCGAYIMFTNVSCTHTNQYPKETTTLDSLGRALKTTDSLLKTVDSARIRKCVNRVIIAMDYIKISGQDSISQNAKEILKDFSNTRWPLQIFLGRAPVLKKEIGKSITQVAHLSHDLKDGLIEKDSAMTYYSFEVKKAGELMETAKYGMDMVKMQMPVNELIAPQADSLVNRLKNHEKI